MNSEVLWKQVTAELQVEVSPSAYNGYINRLVFEAEEHDEVLRATLLCPTAWHKREVERMLVPVISSALNRITGKTVELGLVVAETSKKNQEKNSSDTPLFSQPTMDKTQVFKHVLERFGLREELSLTSFAVSGSNEMAFAAAKAVAANPGRAYNPLFLYGGVGVGKTHLMQGIGQEIVRKNSDLRLIYCTGEEFTNEIIDAIRQKSTPAFRRRYRGVDLLLIDDIQFIAGKASVQEEFFHTFNAITNEGGQVIMTSDKPPKEIDMLEERLRSRFEGGLSIDIGQPDFELRTAILMIKARQLKLDLPAEVAQVVAQADTDTRTLLGNLKKVIAQCNTKGLPLNRETAVAVLGDLSLTQTKKKSDIKPFGVIEMVCEHYNSRVEEVVGVRRQKQLTKPRHVAMYLLKTEFKMGLVEIGNYFSRRDHTSVMHAVSKVTELIYQDSDTKQEVEEIKQKIWG